MGQKKYLNTQTLRKEFRKYIYDSGNKPFYKNDEYRKRIDVHLSTLEKYLNGFKKYYQYEYRRKLKGEMTVRKVFDIYLKNKKKYNHQFLEYFKNKTWLSYEILSNPKPLKLKKKITEEQYLRKLKKREMEKKENVNKLGEFTILILAEYTILHNYMWASRLKKRRIHTIDDFLVNYD